MTLPKGIEALEADNNEGYGGWKLPCTRDAEIADLLDELGHRNAEDADLAESHAPVLRVFAERMATLARRRQSVSDLRLGLEAVALAARLGDSREAVVVMPLLWRTAEVLAVDPGSEFSRLADRHDVKELRAFVSRRPEDRSIESMGYIETYDEAGFAYDRTW